MTFDKRNRKLLREYCGEIHDDDGIDPRTYFKNHRKKKKEHHKTRQLCRQVEQTLSYVFSDCADERLLGLSVLKVQPAPGAAQLLVTLHSDSPGECVAEILQRLVRLEGRLRSEIAAAISRKRTPRLRFQIVQPPQSNREAL